MATILRSAKQIALNVNTSKSNCISFDELSAYFAAVNAQYERESDGTKEARGILRNLNPLNSSEVSPSCTVEQFATYLSTTFQKYPEKLERLLPLSVAVQEAWAKAQSKIVGGKETSTPPWERGEMEKPAGTKDMGGWTRGVFTLEQQNRLGVDEDGQKILSNKKVQVLPPAHLLPNGMEAPAGTKDMGSFTRGVYTSEQQARLGVDEDGKKVHEGKSVQVLPPAHLLPNGMEAPAGTKDMGSFTRAVYSMEQKIRLSVDENGKKQPTTDLLLSVAFENFDEDGNQSISCEEFADFAKTLGGVGQLSNEMVQIMIDTVDQNGDHVLQLNEFKTLISKMLLEEYGEIENGKWHPFFCEHFLTKRQARIFNKHHCTK